MTRQIKMLVLFAAGLLACNASFAQGPPLPPGHNARLVVVNVMLQGFYDPAHGTMRRAQYWDEGIQQLKDRFADPIAERITVQLRDKDDYSIVVTQDDKVNLLSDGKASFYLSSELFNDQYYITIITRNHLETTSAAPVSFAGTNPVEYNFTDAAEKAYGANQAQLTTGVFGLYAGDILQNGEVTIEDRSSVINALSIGARGYIPEDLDGNGEVDINDRSIVITSLTNGRAAITPN